MSVIILFSASKQLFFCRNDVQAIDFLRKGSYAPALVIFFSFSLNSSNKYRSSPIFIENISSFPEWTFSVRFYNPIKFSSVPGCQQRVTARQSEGPLLRRFISPKVRQSEGSLVRRPVSPNVLRSVSLVFRPKDRYRTVLN